MEEAVRAVLALVDSVTPAQACQAYYTLGAAAILAVKVLPQDIQSTLLSYGPRDQGQGNGLLSRVLKGTEVPHAWFLHFYVLSVASSALWAWQLVTRGTAMEWLARRQSAGEEDGAMTMAQVYLAWGLMAVQGVRRLYESLAVTKAGSSPMSAIHYLIGSSYYVVMGVSVWIQGSGAILDAWGGKHEEVGAVLLSRPSTVIGVGLFALGWVKQNQCHRYLASLKKYTLPDEGWFRRIVCAHYTSECIIYLGLAVATAPPDALVNRTVLLGLVFVGVNLGTTAYGTWEWYGQKFGRDKVAGKWRMIPFVF